MDWRKITGILGGGAYVRIGFLVDFFQGKLRKKWCVETVDMGG